ncbi:MAG: hypothetical protein ABIL09_00360 [Gemmatimonadota bacterium]
MKTLEFDAGPDEVLEEVDVDGVPFVRVRRKVPFLKNPVGNAASTVTRPASGETFTAVKGDAPETPAPDAAVNGAVPVHAPANKEMTVDGETDTTKADELTPAQKAGLGERLIGAIKQALGMVPELPPEATATKADGTIQPVTIAEAAHALSEKAGKVISTANMGKLQAAMTSLQAILDGALPPPATETEAVAQDGEAAKADDDKAGEDAPTAPPAGTTATPGGTPATEPPKADATKESEMDAETLKALQDKVAVAKAAADMDAMKAALDEIDAALKGEEPTVEARAEKAAAGAVKAAVAEALKDAGFDALKAQSVSALQAVKAIIGLPQDGDNSPLSQEVLRLLNGARTEDEVARAGNDVLDSGPAGPGGGRPNAGLDLGGVAVPTGAGGAAVAAGRMSTKGAEGGDDERTALKATIDGLNEKLAELRGEVRAMAGALPAGVAPAGLPARKQAGTGGWSEGTGLFDN